MTRFLLLLLTAVLTFAAGLATAKIPSLFRQDRQNLEAASALDLPQAQEDWTYIPGFCTCAPDFSGEVSHRVGQWERKSEAGKREAVFIDYYRIESANKAAKIIRGIARRQLSGTSSCRAQKFELADESYLVTCTNESNSPVGSGDALWYRSGADIVVLWGGSRNNLESWALESMTLIPNS